MKTTSTRMAVRMGCARMSLLSVILLYGVSKAAGTQPLIRFTGTVTIGRHAAPAGTKVTVIVARTATDITVGGTGTVTGSDGAYTIDVPPKPEFACNENRRYVNFIFVVNGENVGVEPVSNLYLDQPSSLGRTRQVNLHGTDIPSLTTGQSASSQTGTKLNLIRFYGTVKFGPNYQPAPVGTKVTVLAARSMADTTACATGTVRDRDGSYVIDVPPKPENACNENRRYVNFIFVVNGENVGVEPVSSLYLDQPTNLSRTRRVDLHGTKIPTQSDQFNRNTSPDEADPTLQVIDGFVERWAERTREDLFSAPLALLTEKVKKFKLAGALLEVAMKYGTLDRLVQDLNVQPHPNEDEKEFGRRLADVFYDLKDVKDVFKPGKAPEGLQDEIDLPTSGKPRTPPTETETPKKPRTSPDFKSLRPIQTTKYRLSDRSTEWSQARTVKQRNQISEEIGEEGMEAAAKDMGYWLLLTPDQSSKTPQGFDAVYWDNKEGVIVICEAKGGYNGKDLDEVLGDGYGYRQGTIEWARAAAERVTRALKTNDLEVRRAEQILNALKTGKPPVRIEVFHTEHSGGIPGVTKRYITDGVP